MSKTETNNTDETIGERRSFLKNVTLGAVALGGLGFIRPQSSVAADSEMITVTATLSLNPDNVDAAIAGLQELVAAVEANEPGVLAYICNRNVQNPNEIMFFEIYENQAATKVHGQTPHMAKFRADGARFFIGEMAIGSYQQLAGYHR
jgi:quinol monooxygenase YgiN